MWSYCPYECAQSLAHVALTSTEELESLTVRLESSKGTPFLELEVPVDDVLEIGAVGESNTRDHELHHVDESGHSKRRRRREKREIYERWHRRVGSKIAPHVRYYRGWDEP